MIPCRASHDAGWRSVLFGRDGQMAQLAQRRHIELSRRTSKRPATRLANFDGHVVAAVAGE